jgi:predicted membrane protein
MSNPLYAARLGDALSHTSMMADILGGVLEVAANVAITALATAAVVAATRITVATGGIGACVLGAVIGVIVGVAMSKTGADKGLSSLCEDIGNGLFPPTLQANILTGSTDTFVNGGDSGPGRGAKAA